MHICFQIFYRIFMMVRVEKFNDLFQALDQVNWFPDNELIRWMNRKGVTTTLADEITRICGASIDIQEGSGARSHPKFYAGRETLDLLCPNAECGVEIVRQLHGNSDKDKLRIFLNEILKPVAMPKSPGYGQFEVYNLHYFLDSDSARYQHVFSDVRHVPSTFHGIAKLFNGSIQELRLPLEEIVNLANEKRSSGNSKDEKYFSEIRDRADILRNRHRTDLVLDQFRKSASLEGNVRIIAYRGHTD